MKNKKYILYTWNHKKAFLKVEKNLLGKNTLSGYLHDVDKLIMYFFLNKDKSSEIHRNNAKHHKKHNFKRKNLIQKMIDWECARITKPDKPLDAYETLYKYYPELENHMIPLLKEFKLDKGRI